MPRPSPRIRNINQTGGRPNVYLTGQADGLNIEIELLSGVGTLRIDGGTESDGIVLNGDVRDLVARADRSFDASGTFVGPNFAGDTVIIAGNCA